MTDPTSVGKDVERLEHSTLLVECSRTARLLPNGSQVWVRDTEEASQLQREVEWQSLEKGVTKVRGVGGGLQPHISPLCEALPKSKVPCRLSGLTPCSSPPPGPFPRPPCSWLPPPWLALGSAAVRALHLSYPSDSSVPVTKDHNFPKAVTIPGHEGIVALGGAAGFKEPEPTWAEHSPSSLSRSAPDSQDTEALRGLPALEASDLVDKDSPFYYDWESLQLGGMIFGGLLCIAGILIALSEWWVSQAGPGDSELMHPGKKKRVCFSSGRAWAAMGNVIGLRDDI
ncbi:PREDICTED: uncharacterized protein LOC101372421 [Odobenus rosmarus divergens]|uniref:FXYD domain-containing ion transport regulator n=1 Tax=Odobenus rosmarus divergens TaxID=9708 RepID=A0A9B0H205_ODORO